MAFVRTKKVKGKEYRYLVENYRDHTGKVKQRTIRYLGAGASGDEEKKMVTTSTTKKIQTSKGSEATSESVSLTFEEYLNYDDGTNTHYELVDGKLVEMPPASFLYSDIIDLIADCFKAIAKKYKLDIKVKTGDVGVRTGINKSRIPDLSVIDGQVWRSYRRDKSAVIEDNLLLVVEVVSPGEEQILRDYTEKVIEYQEMGIPEYWIVDPINNKITVLVLNEGKYTKTVFTDNSSISSQIFPELKVTVREILALLAGSPTSVPDRVSVGRGV